jgi:hypothetical protein
MPELGLHVKKIGLLANWYVSSLGSGELLRSSGGAVRHQLTDDTARIAFQDRPIMVRDDNVGVG